MGTASLPTLTTPSVVPDFTFAGGIPKTCGQVCWGAPVDPTSGFAKDPATWDPAIPDNYVDCVACGPYTGPQRAGAARENGTLSPTCGAELERLFRDVESQAARRR